MLRRVEEALERIIDGGLARLSGARVHPLEIARRLQAHMEDAKLIGTDAPYVPNRYRVRLHEEDLRAWAGVAEDVAEQIAQHLQQYAAEQGWAYGSGVQVVLEAGGAQRGLIEIEHQFDHTPPQARFVLEQGEPRGAVYVLGERATIGRDLDCEVRLADPAVSRRHASLEWSYAGYALRDLDSRNGTWVNGVPVKYALLVAGDLVHVGTSELRLEID